MQGEEDEERRGGGFRERGESDNEGGGRDEKFKDGLSSALHPFLQNRHFYPGQLKPILMEQRS